jgi:hypothetical protein
MNDLYTKKVFSFSFCGCLFLVGREKNCRIALKEKEKKAKKGHPRKAAPEKKKGKKEPPQTCLPR